MEQAKPCYTADIKLKPAPGEEIYLRKCFRCCERIEQVMQKHAMKQMGKLQGDKKYCSALAMYHKAKSSGNEDKLATAKQILNARASYFGLTKSDFEDFIVVQQKRYSRYVSSHVAQKIALRVLQAVNSCLYSKGKKIHFRKGGTLLSFEAKQKSSCIILKQDKEEKLYVSMNGGRIRIQTKPVRKNDTWLASALQAYWTDGAYCRIKRVPIDTGWAYYVQMVIHGIPPKTHEYGEGRVGIDIGTSTIAAVSDKECSLEILDHEVCSVEREIRALNRSMDRSRRETNPGNYNDDGTIRKGPKQWVKSKHYRKLAHKRKALYAKRARILKIAQEKRANRILAQGTDIYVEKMNFAALAKRKKETERNSKGKYKRKKRFGKSIGARAPAQQITILRRKLAYARKEINEVRTGVFKASQYNHEDDTYEKKQLGQRDAWIGVSHVQRDLYSAFLLMNADTTLKHTGREACLRSFEGFMENHDRCIQTLLSGAYGNIGSFGLRNFA